MLCVLSVHLWLLAVFSTMYACRAECNDQMIGCWTRPIYLLYQLGLHLIMPLCVVCFVYGARSVGKKAMSLWFSAAKSRHFAFSMGKMEMYARLRCIYDNGGKRRRRPFWMAVNGGYCCCCCCLFVLGFHADFVHVVSFMCTHDGRGCIQLMGKIIVKIFQTKPLLLLLFWYILICHSTFLNTFVSDITQWERAISASQLHLQPWPTSKNESISTKPISVRFRGNTILSAQPELTSLHKSHIIILD